jgi:multicomponent Na+:H+ antiporter subunit B
MKSKIFATTSKYLLPLLLLFSIFLLIRGHNEPGGGFVGGLVAAAAFSLFTIANGVRHARMTLRIAPGRFIGVGLLLALIAGLMPLFIGKPFLTGLWAETEVPAIGHFSTPLLFDLGVFLLVFGVANTIIFSLAED